MTEFDLALDFLQTYVDASATAAERGESIDDRREFRQHCDGLGVAATPQRMELVRDMAGVIRECVERGSDQEDDEGRQFIPTASLAEGLERYGWRIGFLTQPVET